MREVFEFVFLLINLMSQDSISSQELAQEISEAQAANQKLLDSESMAFEQAQEIPLPPPTPSEFWTEEEKKTLLENRKYFEEMVQIVDKAVKEGPIELPKKPKRKIEQLFKEKTGVKKSRNDLTTPQALHNYLISNQADIKTTISREAFSEKLFENPSNEDEMVERLNKGVRNLARQDAQTMMIYIQFGNFLILCKNWQEKERKEGRITETWADWLKAKTGYSDVHARKLRAVAGVLYGYPGFFAVGLPFRFIYSKLNNIKSMLQVPEFASIWKQDPHVPETSQLQHSQEF